MNNDEIQKFLDGPTGKKIKHAVDNFNITPAQSRNAGVMGSIGSAGGSVTGAALGAGIGAIARHPGQGAGIGAMAGGALGGGGGAALGLYAGRAKGPKKPTTKVAKPKPVSPVGKAFDESKHKRDHGRFSATGATTAGMLGGAAAAAHVQGTKDAARAGRLAEVSHVVNAGEKNPLLATMRQASEAKLLAGRAKDLKQAGRVGGAAALGIGALTAANAIHRHNVGKSFTHPSDEAQHKIAQGGLGVAALADAAGASAAWKESKNAVLPALKGLSAGKKIKTVAGYAKERAAFPIVAGGIAATAVAEHVMHQQQKKKSTTPRDGDGDGIVNEGVRKMQFDSADEVFGKARDHWGGAKTGAKVGATIGGVTSALPGAALGASMGAQGPGLKGTLKGAAKTKGAVKGAVIGAGLLGAAGALHGGAAGGVIGGAIGRSKPEVKKNLSTDVEELFAKAREDVSKLERETKTGIKVGGGIGAGLGALRGASTMARFGGNPKAVAAGAVGGAITHGVVGGAIGGGVGAIKASARKAAVKAVKPQTED